MLQNDSPSPPSNELELFQSVQLPTNLLPFNQQTDVDVPGACAICSITYAHNVACGDAENRLTLESVLDLAVSNEFFSTRGNGTHPKGCVEIGKLFGKVEWGYLGNDNKNGFGLIREKLEKGLPVF